MLSSFSVGFTQTVCMQSNCFLFVFKCFQSKLVFNYSSFLYFYAQIQIHCDVSFFKGHIFWDQHTGMVGPTKKLDIFWLHRIKIAQQVGVFSETASFPPVLIISRQPPLHFYTSHFLDMEIAVGLVRSSQKYHYYFLVQSKALCLGCWLNVDMAWILCGLRCREDPQSLFDASLMKWRLSGGLREKWQCDSAEHLTTCVRVKSSREMR